MTCFLNKFGWNILGWVISPGLLLSTRLDFWAFFYYSSIFVDENSTAAGEVETKVNGEATNGEEAMETNPVDADATSVTNSVDTDANSENSPVETDSVKPVETKLADISDKPAVQETQTIIEEIIWNCKCSFVLLLFLKHLLLSS